MACYGIKKSKNSNVAAAINCKLNGLDDAASLDIAKFGPRMVLPKFGIEIGERVERVLSFLTSMFGFGMGFGTWMDLV